jgi:hypothetical protein
VDWLPSDWSLIERYFPAYGLLVICTLLLVWIAYLLGRIRLSLRSIHFIAANEFADKHDLGKIDLKELP